MPGFPGAACSSSSSELWLSFQASACSRPPEPTISTRTRPSLANRSACLTPASAAHAESVQDPGLDQHEWQTQWEALLPELADAPAEALPEVGRLLDDMLDDRAYDRDDPEIERELETGREVVGRLDEGESVDPGDIAAAVNAFRAVYEQLVAERRAP